MKYRRTTSRKRGNGKISGKKRRKQTGGFLAVMILPTLAKTQ